MKTTWYRPKKKQELINHLEHEHPKDIQVVIQPHRWTVAALIDLHDSIHVGRVIR